jgi:hypothetical protein
VRRFPSGAGSAERGLANARSSPAPPAVTIVLTGQVTDSATLEPIAGAMVPINGR